MRLLNKPLPRLVEPPTPVADITRAVLSLVYWRTAAKVPKARKRLLNKPLPRLVEPPTPVADIKRAVLSLVYWRTAARVSEEEDESAEEEDHAHLAQMQLDSDKRKWQYWRSHPLSNLWKERCCTIRYKASGNEFAIITKHECRILGNRRNLYRHVRELLQLPKHFSLALYFADCHALREWQRHEVRCDDSPLGQYLEGAVLEALVHA